MRPHIHLKNMKTKPRVCRYVIVYDLSENKERYHVDRILKGWGHRVQKSVFLIKTNRHGVHQLKAELEKLNLKTGSVLFLRLQTGADITFTGLPFHDPDQEIAYVI